MHVNVTPEVYIKSIKGNDGSIINFKNDDIVVIVGTNNVGKRRFLKDIREQLIDRNEKVKRNIVLKNINFDNYNFDSERKNLHKYFDENFYKDAFGNYNVQFSENQTFSFNEMNFSPPFDDKYFYKALFTYLTTENRLLITKPVLFGMQFDPYALKILKALEKDQDSLDKINKCLSAIFNKAIDVYEEYTDGSILKCLKVGDYSDVHELMDHNKWEHLENLKKYEDLYEQGDGIRNAVAIFASLIANPHRLFLIDEPETFLHPPQARMLGQKFIEMSKNKQCFITTHNIDFIKGLLEGSRQYNSISKSNSQHRVKIIKIDRKENCNYLSLVDNETIQQFETDKRLQFSNILDGFFYKRIILCEDESDCKFYSRVLENLDSQYYHNVLFYGVGGKNKFKQYIPVLKSLHINFMVIADIDMVSNSRDIEKLLEQIDENAFKKIKQRCIDFEQICATLKESNEPNAIEIKNNIDKIFMNVKGEKLSNGDKKALYNCIKTAPKFEKIKKEGKDALPEEAKESFEEIISFLREYNIFILGTGEIESFVQDIDGHGETWVNNVFESYPDMSNEIYEGAKTFLEMVIHNMCDNSNFA